MIKNIVLEGRDIWKGYNTPNGAFRWLLQGINLEILEGDFIAILGSAGTGKSALLKVLGFRESPDQGAVYFEGRLVGRSGPAEIEQMCSERVWLVDATVQGNKIMVEPEKRLAAVLLDNPAGLLNQDSDDGLLQRIHSLTGAGVAVVIATREPVVAAKASVIYKLSNGMLEKITV